MDNLNGQGSETGSPPERPIGIITVTLIILIVIISGGVSAGIWISMNGKIKDIENEKSQVTKVLNDKITGLEKKMLILASDRKAGMMHIERLTLELSEEREKYESLAKEAAEIKTQSIFKIQKLKQELAELKESQEEAESDRSADK
ncbi:MAG: hypothetical protein ACYS8W_06585 [Planctomycetota bacterium]|jgi:hypothetical protein